MNTLLWILQALVALCFLYSGICKSVFSEKQLVEKGQTGVERLPLAFIRFIGITEILGAIGIILPLWLNIFPVLTIISACCFAFIMIPAGIIHFKRHEYKQVGTNVGLFIVCLVIAFGRMKM
ncbi:DoxX family protein [soil metagenome]